MTLCVCVVGNTALKRTDRISFHFSFLNIVNFIFLIFLVSLVVDRRIFGGDVVSQYTLLSVRGLHFTAYAGESTDPLRFYGPLPHHPLQNRVLQITFLAHQTVGERTTCIRYTVHKPP